MDGAFWFLVKWELATPAAAALLRDVGRALPAGFAGPSVEHSEILENSMLKERPHCRLSMLEYYESKAR